MESIVFDSYRILTKEVALGLSADNIDTIKFLLRKTIGRGVLEKIVTGSDLVQLLEDKCWLSAENVDQLAKFLQLAECHDLKRKVQQYVDSAISRNLSNHE
ncbi:CASP8 and FADD-like apoptosis regulator isoform X2 [Mytilus galloprovincialis]|uniref:CASP8 and FADD-like apoptosis regulator isoform X2 n=1 Tax=Mytilus galloprovincialis TaxID=29158 RepID=UPI003F7B974B